MAKKRIYELINKVVLTVTDLFMVDKSGDTNATYVTGQQIVDLVDGNISRVESVSGASVDNTDPLNPIVNAGTDTNFANTDLTFTANKTHDIGAFELKLDGTVKTVSPSASASATAFAVRNNVDNTDLLSVRGDGTIYARVGQDFYLQGGNNIIIRWETNGSAKSRDYANVFGDRVFESNSFFWRNNSKIF